MVEVGLLGLQVYTKPVGEEVLASMASRSCQILIERNRDHGRVNRFGAVLNGFEGWPGLHHLLSAIQGGAGCDTK